MATQTLNQCGQFLLNAPIPRFSDRGFSPLDRFDVPRRAALRHSNEIIKLLGGVEAKRLSPGRMKSVDDCAIGRTILEALGARYTIAVGTKQTVVYNQGGYPFIVQPSNSDVALFIVRFDASHYHDLIA